MYFRYSSTPTTVCRKLKHHQQDTRQHEARQKNIHKVEGVLPAHVNNEVNFRKRFICIVAIYSVLRRSFRFEDGPLSM